MNAIRRFIRTFAIHRRPTTSVHRPGTSVIAVTLYGKPGCHLCDDAEALLHALGGAFRIEMRHVDITGDPELFRSFDIRIPVIVFDDGVSLSAPIRETELRGALRWRSKADT